MSWDYCVTCTLQYTDTFKHLFFLYMQLNTKMAAGCAADTIFYGGQIVTMHDECPTVEALATTKEGRILAVGAKTEVFLHGGVDTKYICLEGHQTLLPGFIEPHTHGVHMTISRCLNVNCGGFYYQTYDQIKDLFKKTIANVEQQRRKWCVFEGWDPELIKDLPELNWDILDEFSSEFPIVVLGQNRHIAWANHKAFEVAGITDDTKDPDGGYFVRDTVTKKLTGQMMEPPSYLTLLSSAPPPSYTDWVKAVDEQWDEYARCGFTTITDLLFSPNRFELLNNAVEEKSLQQDCPLRLALYYSGDCLDDIDVGEPPSKQKKVGRLLAENDKLWFQGVKIISDGSPHCGSVAAPEPFLENKLTKKLGFPPSPCYGVLNYTEDQLLKKVQHWHKKGKQIAIHAHGERAIDEALDVYERVLTDHPDGDRRHRIEHLGLAEENHMSRAAKLNLALSFFVAHLYFYETVYSESIFGKKRAHRWAPLSLASKHGLRWTIHQDNPAFPGRPDPFTNMKTAVTRTQRGDHNTVYGKEYCVTIEEALKAYTINAAWQIHK